MKTWTLSINQALMTTDMNVPNCRIPRNSYSEFCIVPLEECHDWHYSFRLCGSYFGFIQSLQHGHSSSYFLVCIDWFFRNQNLRKFWSLPIRVELPNIPSMCFLNFILNFYLKCFTCPFTALLNRSSLDEKYLFSRYIDFVTILSYL